MKTWLENENRPALTIAPPQIIDPAPATRSKKIHLRERSLRDHAGHHRKLDLITRTVAGFCDLSLEEIMSRSRKHVARIAWPRQVAMWLMRRHTGATQQEVAEFFGCRDHSIVFHSVKTVEAHIGNYPMMMDEVRQLEQIVRARMLDG